MTEHIGKYICGWGIKQLILSACVCEQISESLAFDIQLSEWAHGSWNLDEWVRKVLILDVWMSEHQVLHKCLVPTQVNVHMALSTNVSK